MLVPNRFSSREKFVVSEIHVRKIILHQKLPDQQANGYSYSGDPSQVGRANNLQGSSARLKNFSATFVLGTPVLHILPPTGYSILPVR